MRDIERRSTGDFWDSCLRPDIDAPLQARTRGLVSEDVGIPDLGSVEPKYIMVGNQRVRVADAVHPPTTVYPLSKLKS